MGTFPVAVKLQSRASFFCNCTFAVACAQPVTCNENSRHRVACILRRDFLLQSSEDISVCTPVSEQNELVLGLHACVCLCATRYVQCEFAVSHCKMASAHNVL